MYLSYTAIQSHDPHGMKVMGRRATHRVHPRVQRTIGYNVCKNTEQEKTPTLVSKATVAPKPLQNKIVQKLTKSQQVIKKQVKPANFSVKFSKPITPIKYNNKQTTIVSEDNSQVTSRSPLFISDQPVAVMGVNFWMEAGRARTDEEKQQREAGFSKHAFNQYASDRLGYFRDIPDTRHAL